MEMKQKGEQRKQTHSENSGRLYEIDRNTTSAFNWLPNKGMEMTWLYHLLSQNQLQSSLVLMSWVLRMLKQYLVSFQLWLKASGGNKLVLSVKSRYNSFHTESHFLQEESSFNDSQKTLLQPLSMCTQSWTRFVVSNHSAWYMSPSPPSVTWASTAFTILNAIVNGNMQESNGKERYIGVFSTINSLTFSRTNYYLLRLNPAQLQNFIGLVLLNEFERNMVPVPTSLEAALQNYQSLR